MKHEKLTSDELYDILKLEYPYIIEFVDTKLIGGSQGRSFGMVRLLLGYILVSSYDNTAKNQLDKICGNFGITKEEYDSKDMGKIVYAHMYDWIVNNEELLQLRML